MKCTATDAIVQPQLLSPILNSLLHEYTRLRLFGHNLTTFIKHKIQLFLWQLFCGTKTHNVTQKTVYTHTLCNSKLFTIPTFKYYVRITTKHFVFSTAHKIEIKDNITRFTWYSLSSYSRHLSSNSCVLSYFCPATQKSKIVLCKTRELVNVYALFSKIYTIFCLHQHGSHLNILVSDANERDCTTIYPDT